MLKYVHPIEMWPGLYKKTSIPTDEAVANNNQVGVVEEDLTDSNLPDEFTGEKLAQPPSQIEAKVVNNFNTTDEFNTTKVDEARPEISPFYKMILRHYIFNPMIGKVIGQKIYDKEISKTFLNNQSGWYPPLQKSINEYLAKLSSASPAGEHNEVDAVGEGNYHD